MVQKPTIFYVRPAGTPSDLKWYAKGHPTRDPVVVVPPTDPDAWPTPNPSGAAATLRDRFSLSATRAVPIVFSGSSTTAGTGASATANRYVSLTTVGLQARWPKGGTESTVQYNTDAVFTEVTTPGIHGYSLGHGGTTAANFFTAAERTAVAALNPAAVGIMVGSNDAAFNRTPTQYKTDLEVVIADLKTKIPNVVIVLLHSFQRMDGTFTYSWSEYRQVLLNIAAASPSDVLAIDLEPPFIAQGVPGADPNNLVIADNIHPSDAGHALLANGILTVLAPAPPVSDGLPYRYVEGKEPWRLQPGETHLDDVPAGVPIVDVTSYTTTDDLQDIISTIDNATSSPVYVRLERRIYWIKNFMQVAPNDYRGFFNTRRRVMGFVGADRTYAGPGTTGAVTGETIIRIRPTAVSSSTDYQRPPTTVDGVTTTYPPVSLADQLVAKGAEGNPAPSFGYWSNSGTNTPMFFSGITFQGTLQTPFRVYSAATQRHWRMNQTVATPLHYYGISVWEAKIGSRFQFCRFQGVSYSSMSAPPYETGPGNSNRSVGLTIARCEMDGRLAAEVDTTRLRSSGGWMRNKELDCYIENCWQHHTRTSGNATNTNTMNRAERYREFNFQCENIADSYDQYASNNTVALPGGFNGHNIEAVLGKVISDTCYFNVFRGSHYAIAIPSFTKTNGVIGAPYVLPTTNGVPDPIVIVYSHRTDDTLYGGCTRVGTNLRPNDTTPVGGLAPLAKYISDNGVLSANDYIKIYKPDRTSLKTPVFARDFNASIHKKETHYVLTSFT